MLLGDDAADFFNREMENVVLSLDGRREVHDAIRKTVNGKGSFDICFNNIKKFVETARKQELLRPRHIHRKEP